VDSLPAKLTKRNTLLQSFRRARLESDPWANNHVHLKVPKGYNDYIDASLITLVSKSDVINSSDGIGVRDQYTCIRGPKMETVDHVLAE
jgi:protein tyrosine phosphatase